MPSKTSRRIYWVVVAVSIILKLWLTSGIRTAAENAPHDAENFLEHARTLAVGHWFGAYNDLTLIKQPFYPIYLAIVEQSGLPLTVANLLLDALAAVTACIAVRPLLRSQVGRSILFLVLFFNPFTYDTLAWTSDRSQVNPALVLLTVSCAIAVYVRRSAPIASSVRWLFGLGSSFTAFWLTREDALWIVPCLLVIAAAYLFWVFRWNPREFAARLLSCLIPIAMCAAAVGSVMLINFKLYGWAVTNEQQAPELISAYNSLVRIDVPKQRYFPVPRAAREIAYRVSPAAQELRPSIEGNNGQNWISNTCSGMPVLCSAHDIGGGWVVWALRDAVQNAGYYDSGAHARLFYLRLARELDAACDVGKMKCRPKSVSVFPPPMTLADVPAIAASAGAGLHKLLTFATLQLGPPDAPPVGQSLRLDYDFVARSIYDSGFHRFGGWIIYDHSLPPVIEGPGSGDSEIIFSASPDIVQAFKKERTFTAAGKGTARFQLATACDQSCVLVVRGANNSIVRVPLADNVPDFSAPGVLLHLEFSREVSEFDKGLKEQIMSELGKTYQLLFGALLYAWIALLLFRLWRAVRIRRLAAITPNTVLAIAIGMSSAAFMLLLSIMDALAFRAFFAVYMAGMILLLIFTATLTLSLEVSIFSRFLRRWLPKAEGSSTGSQKP